MKFGKQLKLIANQVGLQIKGARAGLFNVEIDVEILAAGGASFQIINGIPAVNEALFHGPLRDLSGGVPSRTKPAGGQGKGGAVGEVVVVLAEETEALQALRPLDRAIGLVVLAREIGALPSIGQRNLVEHGVLGRIETTPLRGEWRCRRGDRGSDRRWPRP